MEKKYVYFRDKTQKNNNNDRKIVSLLYSLDKNEKEEQIVDFTFAFCSNHDRFNKKQARKILNGGFEKGKKYSFKWEGSITNKKYNKRNRSCL